MFDIPSMWAEINRKLKNVKSGATPEQAAQIQENRQNIAILYGVTESIQDVIPEIASSTNKLVSASEVGVIPPVELHFTQAKTFSETLEAINSALDWTKIRPGSYIDIQSVHFVTVGFSTGGQWVLLNRTFQASPVGSDPYSSEKLIRFRAITGSPESMESKYYSSFVSTDPYVDLGFNISNVTIHY